MDTAVLVVFALVYLGMMLGELPGLALDRTGVALLGAIAVVTLGGEPLATAWSAVDMPTIYLLFAMMVVSAQFRLAGFYTRVVRELVAAKASPAAASCCTASPASPGTRDWSLALEKAKCRGAATQWLTLGAALPAPELMVTDEEVPTVDRWSIVDEWTLSCADRPEAPPPRA